MKKLFVGNSSEAIVYILARNWRQARSAAIDLYIRNERAFMKTEKLIGFSFERFERDKSQLIPYKIVIDRATGEAISIERSGRLKSRLEKGRKEWKL